MTEKRIPTILVIFGISGDLSKRFLLPAIEELTQNNLLPTQFEIIGITRQENLQKQDLLEKSSNQSCLSSNLELHHMNASDKQEYIKLENKLADKIKNFNGKVQVLFYLSVPPNNSKTIIKFLGEMKLIKSKKITTKLLTEKPFGYDLKNAKDLITYTQKYFSEKSIYRIDHYLAKHITEKIILIKEKSDFKKIFNNKAISRIDIVASEELGIEKRANFYEQTGALRDMIGSHLLELTAFLFTKQNHSGKIKNLPSLRLAELKKLHLPVTNTKDYIKRGQYVGYKTEANNLNSKVETFVSVSLVSSAKKWKGVTIVLSSGKALKAKSTYIKITYKDNKKLDLILKEDSSIRHNSYIQILSSAIYSNKNLFISKNEVLQAWKIIEPIQKEWQKIDHNLIIYEKGTQIESLIF